MKILLTHGHTVNGSDRGSVAHNGLTEGQLNYNLVKRLSEVLTNKYYVDVDVKQEEVDKALQWNVKNRNGYDIALSVHHNAFNKKATGSEVLYKTSSALAIKLSENIAKTLNIANRGAKKRTDLYILNIGFDALLEICFIDNKNDFITNYSVENLSLAIAKTIVEHYNLKMKSDVDMIAQIDILIDGEKYTVNRILKDGKNYIELREFEKAGYTVGYDANKKMPLLNKK